MPRASSHLLPSASLRTCAYVQGLLHEVGAVAIGLLIKPLWLKHGALLRTEAAAVCKRWIIMMPATSRSGTVTNDSERSAAPTSMFLDWYQACRGKQAHHTDRARRLKSNTVLATEVRSHMLTRTQAAAYAHSTADSL
jgi:hypothetical protein